MFAIWQYLGLSPRAPVTRISRDAYKTKQWTELRAGDRLCRVCETKLSVAAAAGK